MSESVTVRIGVKSARELEIVVEDGDAVAAAYEKAIKSKDSVLWVTDTRGHRYGVHVDGIAFVEIDQPSQRGVGF
jgi:hypothetical protein